MNPIALDILRYYNAKNDELFHYGVKYRSGRYPYGSGEDPYQHDGDLVSRVKQMRADGLTEKEIASALGMSTGQLRTQLSIATHAQRVLKVKEAEGLKAKGYSNTEIAEMMGLPGESSVRSLLNERAKARMNQAQTTADMLKDQVDQYGLVDIGAQVALGLGISDNRLDEAVALLQEEGYEVRLGRIEQVTNPGKMTTVRVLAPPGTPKDAVYKAEDIHYINEVSHDGGETYDPKWVYPASMDSSRLSIRYGDEGGKERDGTIQIRRGVEDLSLGESTYAQVRILVDGTHYIKGMAVYADDKDMPEGVDIVFNTNKPSGTAMTDVLKKIKNDPVNPFGSLLKEGVSDPDDIGGDDAVTNGGQSYYYDKDGNKKLSLINKAREEGDWNRWDNTLPSQFLSKQSKELVEKQLKLTIADSKAEFDAICALENPTLKKKLLQEFANECDGAAVHLKAAALPRQRYQVIVAIPSLKDNEIYAPNFKQGETVALIRYPHGGTFEIPVLKVNNNNKEGKSVITNSAADAVGINSKVAEQLSGADFDGDTVMVIPCNSTVSDVRINSRAALPGLVGFDNKLEYGCASKSEDADGTVHYYDSTGKEYKHMGKALTQTEMGKISNLITDMTIIGASDEDLTKAVKHSMVVIDANKHGLNYKQSEIDNNIAYLKEKYQGHYDENGVYRTGAATIISRAKAETSVTKRQGSGTIDKETGKITYKESDTATYSTAKIVRTSDEEANATIRESAKGIKYIQFDDSEDWIPLSGTTKKEAGTRVTATLATKTRTQQSTQMAETDDAFKLVSDSNNAIERLYASYANAQKDLANQARKEMVNTKGITYSASAAKTYAPEVASLTSKLNAALLNAPRERHAQILANSTVKAKQQENPDMTKADLKKVKQQALTSARAAVGAERQSIKITDKEWEAIQAGAVSHTVLTKILNNTDTDSLRERAMPSNYNTQLSQAQINRIKSMSASGYTNAEIAELLNFSASTVTKYLK